MRRDWSLLPVDIINKIAELRPLPHRSWLRLVCKSWQSAIPPLDIPTPWVLHKERNDNFYFLSILSQTVFVCPVPPGPDFSGMHCVGYDYCWLVMCGLYFNICLINPVTSVRFDLPPFSSYPNFIFEYTTADDGSSVPSGFHDYRLGLDEAIVLRSFDREDYYIQKIVCYSDPGCEDFRALALFGAGNLASITADQTIWYELENLSKVQDIVCRKGEFWALTPNGEVIRIDFPRTGDAIIRTLKMSHDPIFDTYKYIAFDHKNKLYMILRHGEFQMHSDGKRKFHTKSLTVMKNSLDVFKDDADSGSWEPVEDLNDYNMLIGNNDAVFLSPREYSHMKGNIVCVTGIRGKDEILDSGVYDMKTKEFRLYRRDTEYSWTQPPAVWFEPYMPVVTKPQ